MQHKLDIVAVVAANNKPDHGLKNRLVIQSLAHYCLNSAQPLGSIPEKA